MKKLFFLFLFSTFIITLNAKSIDSQKAKIVAKNFYLKQLLQFNQLDHLAELSISETYIYGSENETPLYIFNMKNFGYVIVAGDDALEPVIGYSYNCLFDPVDLNPEFKYILNSYTDQLKFLNKNAIKASKIINDNWNSLLSLKMDEIAPCKTNPVGPLLSCTWNQDDPYNYYCPEDPAGPGGRVYVGCVATAMAQIMYYWRYPIQGSGSKTYYCYPYGSLSANFGDAEYHWDGMVDQSSNAVNLAIAEISYHCAVAVEMDFGPNGSASYSMDALYAAKNNFNYDNSCQYLLREGYSLSAWENMLIEEIDDHCPVYYRGRTTEVGHAFVIDGYEQDEGEVFFHFNFGWDGSGNGFFLLSDAGGWTIDQGMIRNFYPDPEFYPYECGDNLLTSLNGTIEDGSGPQANYENSQSCTWLISPQTESDSISNIKISFIRFDLHESDHLILYDGQSAESNIIGEYTGSEIPAEITSQGNSVLIAFNSDESINSNGWMLEYEAIKPIFCSGTSILNETNDGYISDGSYNFNYSNGATCIWKIEPPNAQSVSLEFISFETEQETDVLKVYDLESSELLGEFSGFELPGVITSQSGRMFVTFSTNGSITYNGWEAYYYSNLTDNAEIITSDAALDVHPNPLTNTLKYSYKSKDCKQFTLCIYNSMGKEVYNNKIEKPSLIHKDELDLSFLKNGIYYLIINSGNQITQNKKIVKF